jgi:hypothetical protein
MDDLEAGNYHFAWKMMVLGDTGVGKTTLLRHHVQDDEAIDVSVEAERGYCADFVMKSYERDGRKHVIHWWDIPGSDRGDPGTVTRLCAGAAGGILVFDHDVPESFQQLGTWLKAARKGCVGGVHGHGTWALVGNSIGVEAAGEGVVSQADAQKFAEDNGMRYFEGTDSSLSFFHDAAFEVLSNIAELIPQPPEPSLLFRQGIAVGGLLASDVNVRQQLFGAPVGL